jgi:SAM-dependent methyltransferase
MMVEKFHFWEKGAAGSQRRPLGGDENYDESRSMFGFFKKKRVSEAAVDDPWAVRREELAERVIQALGIADDDTVLQIAFGDGKVLRRILPLVPQGRVAGVEQNAERVKAAVEAFAAEYRTFKAEFKEGVVSRLPFGDEYFTKVFALDAVAGWLSIPKGLAEIKRVLYPLGRVVLSLPPRMRVPGEAFVPVVEVKALLRDAGFENLEILPAEDAEASVILMAQKPL